MARIVAEDEPFERVDMPRDEAIEFFQDLSQALKVEHLREGLADEASVSLYRQGEFVDLCRGPHVPTAGAIGAFKLLSVAGAVLEGRRPAAAASAALRHRLVYQAGPGSPPAASGRGQAPRSPRAGQATGIVPHRSGGGLRAGALAAQGGGRPPATGKLPLRRTAQARLSAGLHPGDRQRPPVRDLRPLSPTTRTASSRPSSWKRASGICCVR